MTEPPAPARAYRIGIDVGGTFTKAVLIDNATHEVVGRFSVLTTHSDPRGVAKGVVEVFRNVLEQSGVDPKEVIFLAHSTTQATNALLEGDVASVGVIGMSTRVESLLAKGQSAMKPIELAPGRHLKPLNRFLIKETLTDEADPQGDRGTQGRRRQGHRRQFGLRRRRQRGRRDGAPSRGRRRARRHLRQRDHQALWPDDADPHRRHQCQHPAEDDRHRRP